MKPFLKWLGGKYRVVHEIRQYLPQGNRYIEPFLGAGSVYLNVSYPSYLVNDINPDLINAWQMLKEHGSVFIDACEKFFIPENNVLERYLELREEFNTTKDKKFRQATLFIYLNKHCFNGLCRYNSKGGFNAHFGKYAVLNVPRDEMETMLPRVRETEFRCKDFRDILLEAVNDDIVYCDPPYVPLSDTAYFSNYSKGGFNVKDQKDVAQLAFEAANRGAVVVVSNHFTPFTKELYGQYGAEIHTFAVGRQVSCKEETRQKVQEILAVFG